MDVGGSGGSPVSEAKGAAEGAEARRWQWWAAASSGQLAAGIAWFRRGYGGSGVGMPFKAFAIASLFVGAGATAGAAALFASGVRSVDDMKDVGLGIRRWMHDGKSLKRSD